MGVPTEAAEEAQPRSTGGGIAGPVYPAKGAAAISDEPRPGGEWPAVMPSVRCSETVVRMVPGG